MPDTAIIINLDASNHNTPINSGKDLIQRDAFDALRQQIKADLERTASPTESARTNVRGKSKSESEDLYPHGSGLTYFIDGTRGAGKSTFLRFVYEHLNSSAEAGQGTAKFGVEPLLYLDPSRIESSEIVLLHVLKHLKRLAEDCFGRSSINDFKQDEFRQIFKEMAGGLHLFVSKPDSLKDLDAELFLDYGLDRAADSQRLRKLLHRAIALVCDMQGVRALLLALDDADTKFANAIEVLECVRKYLDTPQMLILVTGDMEMYSLLVQSHFQQDFASEDRGLNADRRKQQSRMVDHLEEQYLLKLFPIQRRVQLRTLHTLSAKLEKLESAVAGVDESRSSSAYQVRIPGRYEVLSLKQAVDEIATQGLKLRAEADKTLFREHILKQPVRSVLQLLSTFYRLRDGDHAKASEAASEALRATALSSLYRHDVDVESIAEGDLHATIEAAFNLSLLDGEPDTAVYLRPQSRDASLRNAYVSLAADVARLCDENPANAITYMLSTAGSSNIYHLTEKAQNKNGSGSSTAADRTELQRKLKQYLSVGRTENALNWSWHATAALIGATSSQTFVLRQGIVGVRTGTKNSAKSFDTQLSNAIVQNAKDTYGNSRPYPAIAFSQSGVKQYGNTQRYLSIFNTLGLIASLLALKPKEGKDKEKQVLDLLNKVRNSPTVSLPNWKDLVISDTDDDGSDESPPPQDAQELAALNALVGQIVEWLKTCENLTSMFHPSAVLLGKIWNRLYFSLDNVSAAMRATNPKIEAERSVKAMELFAWALINACLVEEADHHHREDLPRKVAIDRTNPRTSGELVIEKFKSFEFEITPAIAPLSFMIASCPLVLGLIKEGAKGPIKNISTSSFIKDMKAKLKKVNDQIDITGYQTCSDTVWREIGLTSVSKVSRNSSGSSRKENSDDSSI